MNIYVAFVAYNIFVIILRRSSLGRLLQHKKYPKITVMLKKMKKNVTNWYCYRCFVIIILQEKKNKTFKPYYFMPFILFDIFKYTQQGCVH